MIEPDRTAHELFRGRHKRHEGASYREYSYHFIILAVSNSLRRFHTGSYIGMSCPDISSDGVGTLGPAIAMRP